MKLLVISTMLAATEAFSSLKMGLSVGEKFPAAPLKNWGISGKPSVVYFYGADEAPSCTKQAVAFDSTLDEFKSLGVTVCGVRNEGGVKGTFSEAYGQKFVVDEQDLVRNEIGIAKDLFGLLGGRETYVLDSKGEVKFVFNGQFNPNDHADKSLLAAKEAFQGKGGGKAFKFGFPTFK